MQISRIPVTPRPRAASPLKPAAPAPKPTSGSPLTDRPRAPRSPMAEPKAGPLATVLMAGGAIGGFAALLVFITGGGVGALATAGLALGTAIAAGVREEMKR